MKRSGFTLVELIVVVGIIVMLAVTVMPRFRSIIAKANDSKVAGVLGALRSSSKVYYSSNGKKVYGEEGITEEDALNEIIPMTQSDVKRMFDLAGNENGIWEEGEVSVFTGGSKDSPGEKNFTSKGRIGFTFMGPGGTTGDGVELWLNPMEETKEYDTKGIRWASY